ncbi:MAG: aminopeptidase N [Burkholderiaceae bacterium]
MRTPAQDTVYRKDYTPPSMFVDAVEMGFDLHPTQTWVATQLTVRANPAASASELVLHGQDCPLRWIEVNGRRLTKADYTLGDETLTIPNMPDAATVRILTRINPQANTALAGLYTSSGNFFTQCEAQGFRRITWFPDRPDVMAKYTVMLRASKKDYPVLLANGNLVEEGELPGERHYAKWEDPFPKPSYLFAVVAGKFVHLEERVQTGSGKSKLLQLYVEPQDLPKAQWAMDSLKHSITWDEERYGLELDLDRFMIVAVGDFNMGAMENKGLNLFNTSAVLAHPDMATDADYARVESVVAHEYFHNWTGNRVTCRDWFQLTLKEGLTVFRDQQFSSDMVARGLPDAAAASARAVLRIEQVRDLRDSQFPEDAGPMAHPVRPDSFQDISNFYTPTVYEKGAEVIRMQHTLIGEANFRKGMDLYFARHDGQAVTCDDFVQAMQDASGRDLMQFRRWYSQAGTPRVSVQGRYDAQAKTYTLTLSQHNDKVGIELADAKLVKPPLHIPVAMGLVDAGGNDIPLKLQSEADSHPQHGATTRVLDLIEGTQTFTFVDVPSEPTPSLLRNFSAPVLLQWDASDAQLAHLLAHDTDAFNRWEAGQSLALRRLMALQAQRREGKPFAVDTVLADAVKKILLDPRLDPAFKTEVLSLPDETMMAESADVVDPQAIRAARVYLQQSLGQAHLQLWAQTFAANKTPGVYSPNPVDAGKRALKQLALRYWLESADSAATRAALSEYETANNMTDRAGALAALLHVQPHAATVPLAEFYTRYAHEPLAIDRWFRLQAGARSATVAQIEKLARHKAFTLKNPNRLRALLGTFCMGNPAAFHSADGYALWSDLLVRADAINPEMAARMARALDRWRRLAPALQAQAQHTLQGIAKVAKLSKPTREVVEKALTI